MDIDFGVKRISRFHKHRINSEKPPLNIFFYTLSGPITLGLKRVKLNLRAVYVTFQVFKVHEYDAALTTFQVPLLVLHISSTSGPVLLRQWIILSAQYVRLGIRMYLVLEPKFWNVFEPE
jgi:hypothetical protein